MASKPFNPWRRDLHVGGAMMIIGVSTLAVLIHTGIASPLRYGPFAVLLTVFGYWRAERGYYRWHGKHTEGKALAVLRARLPSGWTITNNVMTASGDCDAIVSTGSIRFVVEIKSVRAVTLTHKFFGPTTLAFGRDVGATPASHLAQAAFNAGSAGGVAILWYPLARKKNYGLIGATWVVTGAAGMLVGAMQKHLATAR